MSVGLKAYNLGPMATESTIASILIGPSFTIAVQTVAATSTYDYVAERRMRVMDCWCVATGGAGGAGDTVTLHRVVNGAASAITDAMDTNDADKTISRITTIDDAEHTIQKGQKLRVTTASGSVSLVYIRCAWLE